MTSTLRTSSLAWGCFRRLRPFCDRFGYTRGIPVDRWYIERFLASHQEDIQGHVLEVGDPGYTRRFGGPRVLRCDVLQHPPGDRHGTIVGDLTRERCLPADTFDCILFTQTLECLEDWQAALGHVYAALRPGGVLLLTSGAVARVSRYDLERWGDYRRFTPAGLYRMLADFFPPEGLDVRGVGNRLASLAFLYGLARHELHPDELAVADPACPLVVTARAVRPPVKPRKMPRRESEPTVPDPIGRRVEEVDWGELRSVALRHDRPRRPRSVERYYRDRFLERFVGGASPEALVLDTPARLEAAIRNGRPLSQPLIVCPHVLHKLFDCRGRLPGLRRLLAPGGVCLVCVPGISPNGEDGYWRFTDCGLRSLFEQTFAPAELEVVSYGNVLSAAAAILGCEAEELTETELDHHDPDYPVLVGLRARVPGGEG